MEVARKKHWTACTRLLFYYFWMLTSLTHSIRLRGTIWLFSTQLSFSCIFYSPALKKHPDWVISFSVHNAEKDLWRRSRIFCFRSNYCFNECFGLTFSCQVWWLVQKSIIDEVHIEWNAHKLMWKEASNDDAINSNNKAIAGIRRRKARDAHNYFDWWSNPLT